MNNGTCIVFAIMTLVVMLCVSIVSLFVKECWWSNSVIFKTWSNNYNLDNKIRKCCRIHSKIVFLPLFTDRYYSHWQPGLWDDKGNFIVLSTVASHSIAVRIFPAEIIIQYDDKHLSFIDESNWRYIISNDDVFDVTKELTVADAVLIFSNSHKLISYDFFSTNCHYQTYRFINSISNAQLPPNEIRFDAFKKCVDELLDSRTEKYTSKVQLTPPQ